MKKEDYIKPEITVISAEPLMPLAVSFTPDTDESEEDADAHSPFSNSLRALRSLRALKALKTLKTLKTQLPLFYITFAP